MLIYDYKKRKTPLEVGDYIVEKVGSLRKKRFGEIVFVRGEKIKKYEAIQLKKHDLSPITKTDFTIKTFTVSEKRCRRLNLFRYYRKKSFEIGDIIKYSKSGHHKFGKIVGFVHPDEIFTESYEKGFNGKDLLQCVEISSKSGLPRKIGTNKSPKIFLADHQRCKICQILPMGKDGGLRIKNYTEPE